MTRIDAVFDIERATITAPPIDRLVHHATILELNTESYRRRAAAGAQARTSAA